MKGISVELVPYVCAVEKSLPPDDQTIFHVRLFNKLEMYKKDSRLNRAIKIKGDSADVDPVGMYNAKKADFKEAVKKVEKYAFGSGFPDLAEKGIIELIEDEKIIEKMWDDMPPAQSEEILKVAYGDIIVSSEEIDKKK